MPYNSKYYCAICSGNHYQDEECPTTYERYVRDAIYHLGAAKVRRIVDEQEKKDR